ncbi:hypothetical protein ACFRCG_38070 [Embleya sp. NPDC056575]|uniref:hypothetical protein n=1 Tax=unclassified Embleya TaxID=2699296 RepID=UPI00367C4A08
MPQLIGYLGPSPVCADGRHALTGPGLDAVFVGPAPTEEDLVELAARHGLDKVERLPPFRFRLCTAVYLDGPMAGQANRYTTDELGSLNTFATAGHTHTGVHELVALPDGDRPGELRLVELDGRPVTS